MNTSSDSPIEVDFVSQDAHGLSGRLGLTIAPGKCDDMWTRDLAADVRRLREHYRADVLVSLLEPQEREFLRIANLLEAAQEAGITVLALAIPDGHVPASMSQCQATVREMVMALEAGKTVVVHCRGGLGRTGLIAASCLVACGATPGAAIKEVRRARPGAVESPRQEQFVTEFAQARRAGREEAGEADRQLGPS